MVLVELDAKLHCDHPECGAQTTASLALTVAGGFTFKPKEDGWQVLSPPNNPFAPVFTNCPAHVRKLTTARPELVKP